MDRLARQSEAVFLLLAGYFIVNIVVRLSLPASLELDEAEQVFYSQWLAWGYGPQPPLYNWLQTAVFAIMGRSVFGLSLLKNALIFGSYCFYWLAAGVALKDQRMRIVAVLSLFALPQASFMVQQDLSHTVVLISATALFLYAFYRILSSADTTGYALAGLSIGLGFLSKYNFPLLPIAALLSVLPENDLRDRIVNWRLPMAVVLALAIALPHALWLRQNLGLATAQTLGKMTDSNASTSVLLSSIEGLGSLAIAILAFSALLFAIFAAIYRHSSWHVLKARSQVIRVTERMLGIVLIALILIIVATGTTHIRERWLDPFLLVLPLYLCMKIEAAGAAAAVMRKALLAIPLLLMIAIPASILLRVTTASLSGSYTKINIPFDRFLEKIIADENVMPGVVVTEDRHLAGNMLVHLKNIPVMTTQFPGNVLPFFWRVDRPILLAWRTKNGVAMPTGLENWIKDNAAARADFAIKSVALPYHYGRPGDAYRFSYAWLYPVPVPK